MTRGYTWSWNIRAMVPERVKPWFRWLLFWRRLTPPALFLWSFVFLIALGTLGLELIPGLQNKEMSLLDAVFTMTSAVCITGLTVVDTATHFTFAGQAYVLLFIQIGGIGLIALTTMIIGAMGRRLSLRSEMLTMMPTASGERPEVWEIAWRVAKFSLIAEGVGAFLLFLVWIPRFPVDEAAWHAVFHTICAYCNAGMSTFSTNLVEVADSPLGLFILSIVVLVGSFGYLAFEELARWWKTAAKRSEGITMRVSSTRRLSSHTWAVVVSSIVLVFTAWPMFAIFEWNDTLADMAFTDKIVNSWFMSITPRSAGFNTVDYGSVGNDTASLTMLLMFIGGAPGSTGGGIKTVTVAVLLAIGLSRMRGRRFVGFKDRAIPTGTIERAVGILLLSIFILSVAFFAISAIEASDVEAHASRSQFLPVMFETLSAFATTGLSMNATSELADSSKIVVIVLMYMGRVGVLSFFSAMTLRRGTPPAFLRPAQEDVIVG